MGLGASSPDAAATWKSHGIDYPDAGERLQRLREGLQIVMALWTGKPVTFSGRFYDHRGARLTITPLQRPHPPIWIAAMGDRMLALAAELADGWEASYLTPAAFAEKLNRLSEHCQTTGQDVGRIRRSVEVDVALVERPAEVEACARQFIQGRSLPDDHLLLETSLIGDPAQCRDRILQYRDAGVTDFTLSFADFPSRAMLRLFAERILPHLPE